MRMVLLFHAWLLHISWSMPMESWEAARDMKGAEELNHLGSTQAAGDSTASSLGQSSHTPSVSEGTHSTPPTIVEPPEAKKPLIDSPLRRVQSEPLQGQDTSKEPVLPQAEAKDGENSMLVPHSHESKRPQPSDSSGSPPISPPEEPNIFDELKKREKPDKSEWERDSQFVFPRYPPKGEWRIKTYCIDLWRDHISPKLSKAFNALAMIVLAPFLAGPVRDAKYHSIPTDLSIKTPEGVWEVLPTQKKFKWPWAKVKDEGHWKVPTYPAAFSAPKEKVEQENIEDAYYTGMRLEDDRSAGLKELEELCVKAEMSKFETEIMMSDDYLKLLTRLYRSRNELVLAHERMQLLLDEVISDWKGEENVRKLLRGLIEHWNKVEATDAGLDAIVKPLSGNGGLVLRKFDPWAHEMHLSPLILLRRKSDKFLDAVKESKIVEGYLPDQTTRLDRLIKQADLVREYAEKSKEVQKAQDAVVAYAERFRELWESDKVDQDLTRQAFKNIVRSAYKDE